MVANNLQFHCYLVVQASQSGATNLQLSASVYQRMVAPNLRFDHYLVFANG